MWEKIPGFPRVLHNRNPEWGSLGKRLRSPTYFCGIFHGFVHASHDKQKGKSFLLCEAHMSDMSVNIIRWLCTPSADGHVYVRQCWWHKDNVMPYCSTTHGRSKWSSWSGFGPTTLQTKWACVNPLAAVVYPMVHVLKNKWCCQLPIFPNEHLYHKSAGFVFFFFSENWQVFSDWALSERALGFLRRLWKASYNVCYNTFLRINM